MRGLDFIGLPLKAYAHTLRFAFILGMGVITGLNVYGQNFSYTTDLMAGRVNDIGDVLVEKTGDSLDVTYIVTDSNWTMTKTYLHVASTKGGIPTIPSGVPDIQNFDHKQNHNGVFYYKYDNIDVSGMANVFVSANANVTQGIKCTVDTGLINASIPSAPVFMSLSQTGNPAYFEMLIYDFGGNPIYYDYFFGNCVDLENPIFEGFYYYPYMVSSYDSDTALLSCIIDKPENLDLVNYVINQDYKTLIGANGPEIQAAIWTLCDNDLPINGVVGITWNQSKVDYIVADAKAKGEFYMPECDGYFAVLLDQGCVDAINNGTTPNITTQQSIFWLPVNKFPDAYNYSFGECANAWGKGRRFTTAGWGMYFKPN